MVRNEVRSELPWEPSDYGGWGGHNYFETEVGCDRTPIVFVHGNTRSANDWTSHADYFQERGYQGDELWAITFGQRTPTHQEMAAQLDSFVAEVRSHTGVTTVDVVAHSLGVTGVRLWMDRYDRYENVRRFVGIAGANHGTYACAWCEAVGLTIGRGHESVMLNPHRFDCVTHPIGRLNRGSETPGDVEYYTIRSKDDHYFRRNPRSPALRGAEENFLLDTTHDGARESPESKAAIHGWLTEP